MVQHLDDTHGGRGGGPADGVGEGFAGGFEAGTAVGLLPLDWSGHVPAALATAAPAPTALVPAQRAAPAHEVDTPLARMALARARGRVESALDVVRFTAACPACGADCQWRQERQDTRLRSSTDCRCGGL